MKHHSQKYNQTEHRVMRWVVTIVLAVLTVLLTAALLLFKYGIVAPRQNTPPVLPELPAVEETTEAATEPTTRPVPVYTDPPALTSEIALVADLTNNKIVYELNPNQVTAPASLTKIVTVAVALEKYGNALNTTYVTVSKEALRRFEGTIASVVPLKVGETVTMKDLLYAAMLPSACDAANVIAYYFGDGNPELFIDEMNRYVEKLGCKNTHFMNSHGLDAEEQKTTAADMYLIARAAMEIPELMEIVSHAEYTMSKNGPYEPRRIDSTIVLLHPDSPYYFPYAKGIKTGSTFGAGRCLITTAEKDGQSYLTITMKAPYNSLDTETEKVLAAQIDNLHLLQWAFDCAGIAY